MILTELNIIGLCANILGTIILAFSLEAYISSMRLAIDAHELFILSYLNPNRGPIVQVNGTDVHMIRDKKRATLFSWIGIVLVIIGFVCQIVAYLV
ncbi:MAG: hypothetical protein WHW07_01815 [Bacteroidales bacterium]